MVPSEANKAIIYAGMAETFDFRRQEIDHDHPSITEILKNYPRFGDIDNSKLVSLFVLFCHL